MSRALRVLTASFLVLTVTPAIVFAQQAGADGRKAVTPNARDATRKGTAIIQGTVIAADTGAPVRQAEVRATFGASENLAMRSTVSDDEGRFELREIGRASCRERG